MRYLFITLAMLGCGEKATDTGGTDTDTEVTDTDGGGTGCATLTEGGWTANGSCFGMLMTATLTVGSDGCSFEFSDWDMAMSVPEGGSVDGSDVSLTGAGWDDCTGTTDGTSISGSCGDGCTFDMAFDG